MERPPAHWTKLRDTESKAGKGAPQEALTPVPSPVPHTRGMRHKEGRRFPRSPSQLNSLGRMDQESHPRWSIEEVGLMSGVFSLGQTPSLQWVYRCLPSPGHLPRWPRSWTPACPGGAQPCILDPFPHPVQSDFGHSAFSIPSCVSQLLSCKQQKWTLVNLIREGT